MDLALPGVQTCALPISRIMKQAPVPNFQLPRGAKMYDGSTKPEDWLTDYVTAVHIAGGSRRWAVRYVPQMLEGPARIWLNNLEEEIGRASCRERVYVLV